MIKNFLLCTVIIFASAFIITVIVPSSVQAAPKKCRTSFFGIPTWYEFLKLDKNKNCEIQFSNQITETKYDKGKYVETVVSNKASLKDVWLIVLAIIDILATLAGILAVIFIMIGGFKFVTSQANPDKIANAKQTLVNAIIGLIIAIIATQIITYFGKALGS